ncbi:MAG TPA: acyl-CoA dehydrogenase family protein, partial [Solirubrobacteraceae bacterium]|nr:acyl-CoA dehydrogenase family protein [Solirubrobacteraceae bacterium]
MDFDLTQDQQEIKGVARELLAARSPGAKVREAAESQSYDGALWSELVELGWPGIAVAEQHGGQGLGAVELAVLLEELGYACAASPLMSTAVAASVIQACGSDEQRERWLPGLVSGEMTAGVGTRELCADGLGAAVLVLVDGDE